MSNARLVVPALRFPAAARDPGPFLRLAERGVGGFCVFGGEREALADLLRRLQAAAPHPLLIASDMEEGAGQQVRGCSRHPPAAALDPEAAEAAGARTAWEARALGVTMVFAPVCDVVSEPRNPIIQARAFRDPRGSAPRFVRGARRHGMRTCAKHFPGHGATREDSHEALPRVDADEAVWRSRDLPPFAACIEAGVDAIMTAHLACPALTGSATLPATLSDAVIRGLLRREMGFEGLVVTDALLMEGVRAGRTEAEAARVALEAGCDALLCPSDVEGVLAAVEGVDADPSLARVAEAARPLEDPLRAAAAASVECGGELPVGPGPHPLRIHDLFGGGQALASLAGVAWERYAPDGALLERGAGPGLALPAAAVLRRDRAWGGGLELPAAVLTALRQAELVLLFGPRVLLEGLSPRAWVRAPGEDPESLRAVLGRALDR